MKNEEKLSHLNEWLKLHNAEKVGDKVYDGMGVITLIDKGEFFYEIRIHPLNLAHNLGAGYGAIIKLLF